MPKVMIQRNRDTGDMTLYVPKKDLEGDPRDAYGSVDIGADEFYSHLYITGEASPGSTVQVKLVGQPMASPVALFLGMDLLVRPWPTFWRDCYLELPLRLYLLDSIPASGVSVFSATLPAAYPAPYSMPMQALIGGKLTNACSLEAR